MRMRAAKVSQTSRATRGVKLMDLEKGNKVASIARISAKEIPLAANGNGVENGNGTENGNGVEDDHEDVPIEKAEE